ncbi:MAG: hypothetical protein ABI652_02460 [Acidobacteriota bacterium]
MTNPKALEPATLEPVRARLEALEQQLVERERDLATVKADLQQLQTRYLDDIGPLYAKLSELEAATIDAEIRAGLREAPSQSDADADSDESAVAEEAQGNGRTDAGCSSTSATSANDLKAIFRNLAKTIHPDLAVDGPARWRRHSLMAEANRAYAERDADRLRLILSLWERGTDADGDDEDDPSGGDQRCLRKIAVLEERLLAIEIAFADLHASAIWRLKIKVEDARRQGWDLIAEMVSEVTRDIGRTSSRLAAAERIGRRANTRAHT